MDGWMDRDIYIYIYVCTIYVSGTIVNLIKTKLLQNQLWDLKIIGLRAKEIQPEGNWEWVSLLPPVIDRHVGHLEYLEETSNEYPGN